MNTNALIAAARFHALAGTAAANGGFWVSAGGGTANVVAGEIARATGAAFDEALHALDVTGGEDWYSDLAYAQPWGWNDMDAAETARWDARIIAKAACRPVRVSA